MTKSTITREQIQQIIDAADAVITALAGTNDEVHKDDTGKMVRLWDDLNDRHAPPEVVRQLARIALAAIDSEPVELPLDYLQGHKDGLEWAAQLAKANHPETGDLLYDDPIELAKAISKGPDMPSSQPVADSEPVAWIVHARTGDQLTTDGGYVANAEGILGLHSTPLYRHAQPAVDSEPAGYFRRYDPDFDALITQCDKGAQDSFPLYLHAQSEPNEANIARDAQRYRFLRDKDAFGDDGEPGLASWDELIELDMNEFDAAIDARMAHPSVDFLTLDNALQKQERRRCKDRNCNKKIFGYSVDGLCEDCYTAVSQQPAPVVPDEMTKSLALIAKEYQTTPQNALFIVVGWNACRAAMLQAGNCRENANSSTNNFRKISETSTNSLVTPGWIPVSERMPETDGNYWGWWSESKRQGPVWFIKSELQAQFQSSEITHWMPLPAAPQEVPDGK